MKTIVYVIVAIIVVIAVYFAVTQNTQSLAPIGGVSDSLQIQSGSDTTAAIQNDLNSIDTGNLDAEMKNIDDQLNNL
ncbi:MAG: hypothetical protein AAB377_02115 [Patescibacteria group bacterium]